MLLDMKFCKEAVAELDDETRNVNQVLMERRPPSLPPPSENTSDSRCKIFNALRFWQLTQSIGKHCCYCYCYFLKLMLLSFLLLLELPADIKYYCYCHIIIYYNCFVDVSGFCGHIFDESGSSSILSSRLSKCN